MVCHSSKRKKQNQKKSQKIGECHVFPVPVRRITFLWSPWGFDNHNACQVTWAVSELEEHVESALPYPHKEEKNQYTTKLRLQIAINWLKAIVSKSHNWIRMLVWPQLPPPPQAFQVDIQGEIIKTAWASHYSQLKRHMLTSHPNIFINLAQTWHECPRNLDLSYWKHKKGFWEWEGRGNGKMWCQQRMCLGVHMSGFIWSHRLQPWEMLKSGATLKTEPTVILDTEGQTFSHKAYSGVLIRGKRQEQAEPCLHGPLGWESAAATPQQLSFLLCNWNSSVKQQNRALTHAYQTYHVQSHCHDQSWWDS